jgi:hypothetical protein
MHFNAVLSLVAIDPHIIRLTRFLELLNIFPVDSPVDIMNRLSDGDVSS